MRLRLRYSLRTLFLIVLVVAIGLETWRWVTWPTRTLQTLDKLLMQGRSDAAEALIVFEPNYRLSPAEVARTFRQSHTPAVDRSWSDVLMGRRTYMPIKGGVACWVQTGSGFDHVMIESVTIQRGTIHWRWGCTMKEWFAQGH